MSSQHSHMAQSSSSSDEKIDTFTGVPAFWPKPTPKPSMLWKDWMVRFYLATDLKDGCYTRALLEEPAEVTPEPAPKLEEAEEPAQNLPLINGGPISDGRSAD